MREYIFNFSQEFLLKKGLKVNDALILDYMNTFFSSGKAKSMVIDGKTYYYLTLNKILSDLPILNIKERQLRRFIDILIKKNLLEQYLNKPYYTTQVLDKNDKPIGHFLPPIDNYNNKKNNIYINELKVPHARVLNITNLNNLLHTNLQLTFSSLTYKLYLKDLVITNIEDNLVTLSSPHSDRINSDFLDDVLKALKLTLGVQ